MEYLKNLDEQLFLYLNSLHHPALDKWMVMISSYAGWISVFVFFGLLIYLHNKRIKDVFFYSGSVLFTIGLTNLLKIFIKRSRPIHHEEWADIIHNIDRYSYTYSFYSSHAASAFCIAMFTFLSLENKRWIGVLAFIWALVVSYSRIYVSKHFPGDVLVGILVGCLFGYLGFYIKSKFKEFNT